MLVQKWLQKCLLDRHPDLGAKRRIICLIGSRIAAYAWKPGNKNWQRWPGWHPTELNALCVIWVPGVDSKNVYQIWERENKANWHHEKRFFFHRRCYVRPALNTMDWPEFFQVLCILYISKLQLKSWYGTKLPANMLVVEFHFLTK